MMNRMGVFMFGIVLASAWGVNAAPTFLTASMDGFQVAVSPGDPDGTGTALVTIDPAAELIDWSITASDIDLPPTGVQIHVAPPGVAGPIVVDLSGQLSGSTFLDATTGSEIVASPTGYYINVLNETYPDGAIRGQLALQNGNGGPQPVIIPVPGAIVLTMVGLAGLRLRRKPL